MTAFSAQTDSCAPAHRICPVWLGYFLANPLRKLFQNPVKILSPFVRPGMRVIDIGPGMGFFALPMARLAGPNGRVFCVDMQEKMLEVLSRRARRAGLGDRIETRICDANSLRLSGLDSSIDFALIFAVVHEVADKPRLFGEIRDVLKPGAKVLFAEPGGHVTEAAFRESIGVAKNAGFREVGSLKMSGSRGVILERI